MGALSDKRFTAPGLKRREDRAIESLLDRLDYERRRWMGEEVGIVARKVRRGIRWKLYTEMGLATDGC